MLTTVRNTKLQMKKDKGLACLAVIFIFFIFFISNILMADIFARS